MLEAVPRDASVNAHLCVIITRDTLPLRIGPVPVLAKTWTPSRLSVLRRTVKADLHGVRVVEGDRPCRRRWPVDRRAFGHRVCVRGELVDVGRDEVGNAHPHAIALPPRVDVDHAGRGLHPIPFSESPEIVGEPLTAGKGMEEGEVRRVHAVFLHLQPIALPQSGGAGHEPIAGQVKRIEDGKIRLLLWWSHIGEHQPAILAHGIGAVIQPFLQRAVGGLARRFEDRAVGVEQPPVIAAPYPFLGYQAKLQRRTAMGTMELQEAHRAALVTEHHEILAQDAQTPRQVVQFLGKDDRLPKAPQVLAAWCARSNPGELFILRRPLAMVIRTVGRVQKRQSCSHDLSSTRGARPADPRLFTSGVPLEQRTGATGGRGHTGSSRLLGSWSMLRPDRRERWQETARCPLSRNAGSDGLHLKSRRWDWAAQHLAVAASRSAARRPKPSYARPGRLESAISMRRPITVSARPSVASGMRCAGCRAMNGCCRRKSDVCFALA